MLSDIGEVTEVESAAGGNSLPASPGRFRLVNRNFAETDAVFRSSPTMGETGTAETTVAKPRRKATTRERSGSIDSTSTVTTAERPNVFGDFDDAVSVGDSSFQGDDEESVAESFADDASVQSARLQPSGNGSGLNEENRFSTSSIGRRAELILANAKRRLTVSYTPSGPWPKYTALQVTVRRAGYGLAALSLFFFFFPSPSSFPLVHRTNIF